MAKQEIFKTRKARHIPQTHRPELTTADLDHILHCLKQAELNEGYSTRYLKAIHKTRIKIYMAKKNAKGGPK